MCGIICTLLEGSKETQIANVKPELMNLLQNRGPDLMKVVIKDQMLFGGFVLWQQGSETTPQPIEMDSYTLLLNGDIFNCPKEFSESDTQSFIRFLVKCKHDSDILDLLKTIKGPYSIIFYNSNTRSLYFCRDSLGRNSLLLEINDGRLSIMSTSYSQNSTTCIELPPLGLYKMLLDNKSTMFLFPWSTLTENQISDVARLENSLHLSIICCESIDPTWLSLDSELEPTFNFYNLTKEFNGDITNIFSFLLADRYISESIENFIKLLSNSVRERVQTTTNWCSLCINSNTNLNTIKCGHSKVGILFSGGIDCSILAAVAHRFIDKNQPIDLINVAFETCNNKSNNLNWDVPDRCSAKESHQELTKCFPERIWNLVEVNVSREELQHELKSHIRHLIFPLNTILDESLGCAFWFASRGIGILKGKHYQSNCRVLLLGSGADELFGGYTRHRNAYSRCNGCHDEKIQKVKLELDMDWERIPSRNLGRDDRVISDNRKTARAPFIQEDIVRFVRNLKAEQKCCFTLSQGLGDKLFLRLCGFQLGLRISTQFKKRAIQFGSRIADKNQNGKDISFFLQ